MNKKLSWVVNNLKEENSIEELATFKNLFDNNKFKSVAEAAKMASILYKENHSDYDNKKSTIFRFAKSCIPNEESLDHKGRVAVDIIAKIHKLICD